MVAEHRRDWTTSEKLEFEDIAIQFIATVLVRYQTHKHFESWLEKYHPDFTYSRNIIWSYVLEN